MTGEPPLLFVYNADSGLFNTLADIGHKLFSPETYECRLCALTYGLLNERKQWRDFVDALPVRCTFVHRDEFLQRYPDDATALPAVFRLLADGPAACLDAAALDACESLGQLQAMIRRHCLADTEIR